MRVWFVFRRESDHQLKCMNLQMGASRKEKMCEICPFFSIPQLFARCPSGWNTKRRCKAHLGSGLAIQGEGFKANTDRSSHFIWRYQKGHLLLMKVPWQGEGGLLTWHWWWAWQQGISHLESPMALLLVCLLSFTERALLKTNPFSLFCANLKRLQTEENYSFIFHSRLCGCGFTRMQDAIQE